MASTRRRLDLIDLIRELTENHQHRELYFRKKKPRYHTTNNPPLLEQLARAASPSGNQTGGGGNIPGSRPAANVDAIDIHHRIHTDATRWLTTLGYTTTGTTLELVRRLGAVAASQDTPTRRAIEADARRWWRSTRITTGWDQPAWAPANSCPLCGGRGTLRIRFVEKLAVCIHDTCRATWDETTIGLLADHIRTENHDTQVA